MQTNNTYNYVDFLAKQEEEGDLNKLFTDQITKVFQWITFSLVCQVVALFGVVSNIINIICFVTQGFKDPVNISFLGLAVADLGCLVPMVWSNLCLSPAFIVLDLPFDPVEFQHLISTMPHFAFTRVSSCITVLITMERCLCIIAPIKIRNIVTSKRVTITIICIYIIIMANSAPIYGVNSLAFKFFPHRNKSLIGMTSTRNKESVERVSYIINNVCIPFGTFMIIIICTIILVTQLRKKAKWRKNSTISAQADNVSTRNQKVAKMVVMISSLFITCYTPVFALFIAMSIEPEFSIVGKYRNALIIFGGTCTLLETINSSSNIFIYYDMSSKYKFAFRQAFNLDSKN